MLEWLNMKQPRGLLLCINKHERIVINNSIILTLVKYDGASTWLHISADRSALVDRESVWRRKRNYPPRERGEQHSIFFDSKEEGSGT